jgi:hypothetical protein
MTMIVPLSGGLILDSSHVLSEVEIGELTGREEEWLGTHPAVAVASAVTALLASCTRCADGAPVGPELARRLLVGDRDLLVLALRRQTLGDTVAIIQTCPACGQPMDVTLDLAQVPVKIMHQTSAEHTVTIQEPGLAARQVRFRLPCGGDQESVSGLDPEQAESALLAACVLDDGGIPLGPAGREQLATAMERIAPQVDVELDLECPQCAQAFTVPFDITAFFLAELRTTRDQILREVHHLALHYHWSEPDILGLPRWRRRRYLSLLADALSSD